MKTVQITVGNIAYNIASNYSEEIKEQLTKKSEATAQIEQGLKGKQLLKENFGCPALDGSFKYIYTRENYEYALEFSRDIETVLYAKSLDDRNCKIVSSCQADREIEDLTSKISSHTENRKNGNKEKLSPDILCRYKREDNARTVLHFEMQNSDTDKKIITRMLQYEGKYDEINQYEMLDHLLGVAVLNNQDAPNGDPICTFNKQKLWDVSVNLEKPFYRKGVVFYLGKSNVGGRISIGERKEIKNKTVEKINQVWEAFEAKKTDGTDDVIKGAIDRLRQRNIAFSLLGSFSKDDFNEYITDDKIKKEFECMEMIANNIEREDMIEQLKISSGVYDLGVQEGEIAGEIKGIIGYSEVKELSDHLEKKT